MNRQLQSMATKAGVNGTVTTSQARLFETRFMSLVMRETLTSFTKRYSLRDDAHRRRTSTPLAEVGDAY